MTDPRDRLLDFALQQVLREPAPQTDLTERVRSAWATRTANRPRLLPEPAPELPLNGHTAGAPARRRRPLALAAAAALLLAAGAVFVFLRDPTAIAPPAPLLPTVTHARARAPITVLRGAELAAVTTTELQSGDVIASPAAVELELAGGVVFVGPRTIVRHGSPQSLELVQGSLDLRGAEREIVLRTAVGELSAAAGSSLTASIVPLDGDDLLEEARRHFSSDVADRPRGLLVAVGGGRVELSTPDGIELLVAGDTRRVEPAREARWEGTPLELEELMTELVESAPMPSAAPGDYPEWDAVARELRAFLGDYPDYWIDLEERLVADIAGGRVGPLVLWPVLCYLALDPAPQALRLGRELWLVAPERFGEELIVAFAERGAFEFERELVALVEAWSSTDEGPGPVLAAAHLALSGDSAGRALLERRMSLPLVGPEAPPATLMAAALALDSLGDDIAWEEALGRVTAAVERALEAGDVPTASGLVLDATWFDEERRGRRTPPLGLLRLRLASAYPPAEDRPGDEAAVRAALRSLRR